ncbi:MAG: hypothetical protein HXX08_14435 [Chloroflexi bacterium]|uniref:Uncharacterized protein n=1 Tax=Candidatus Chlorohelix allophototropha TaxID=3003348 RepID=A0A8T7M4M4_9CHLR|nr:hypothetical protein [Chloroflexota bacterium]WJW70369.1 hypothetical protein OZ401_004943 [Chloroflexota bacterium L227-S17]
MELAVRTGVRAEAELHRGLCLPNNYCPFASDCTELAAHKKAQAIQRRGSAPPPPPPTTKAPIPIPIRLHDAATFDVP